MTQQEPALDLIIDELLEGWSNFTSSDGPALKGLRERTEPQVVTLMSLTAHAHQMAALVRPAIPGDLTVVHMPSVRAIFESTMTVIWCDEVADAAAAMVNESMRQRRALRTSMANSVTFAQMAAAVEELPADPLPSESNAQARHMERMCNDVGLDGGYALYRILSSLSHATVDTVDAYLDAETFVPDGPMSVRSRPATLTASRAWSHLVASCLVWSGMVTNYLDPARTRRNDLRRIARELEIKPVVPVRYDALQRVKGQDHR